jgi:hypothetical protein
MKKLISLSAALFLCSLLTAQIPSGFNYQAVARNADGELITGQSMTVQVQIFSDSENGTLVWQEEQEVSTNQFGLFDMVICGDNRYRTSGTATAVDEILWGSAPHFIGIKMDAGNGMVDLGIAPIRPVPYAMSAPISYGIGKLEVVPEGQVEPDEALFMVRKSNGMPVFAVYEQGVWVYTDTAAVKGLKGGFAVGGYNSAKGSGGEYFSVRPDSTRIYIEESDGKSLKGGFAVGGYKQTNKGLLPRDLLRVSDDSTRIYVNTETNKGLKGGFAVGGYKSTKEGESAFMSLEQENYFIGHNSGRRITTGIYNSLLGYESGVNITEGSSNAFIGYQSGYMNQAGSGNLFLGYQTGFSNKYGNYNTFLGYQAGFNNVAGTNNTFLGTLAGYYNNEGHSNTFVGDSTGYYNASGTNNTFIGTRAGVKNITGNSNVAIGETAGYNNNGHSNVFIGHESGQSSFEASGNVFVGYRTGLKNRNASNNIFMGTESGSDNVSGWNNIFVGTRTGNKNVDGEGNVYLGYESGMNNQHGTRNVFIGNWSGRHETGSNKLYITTGEQDSTSAFIWGDFESGRLRMNTLTGIGKHPEYNNLEIYEANAAGTLSIQGKGNGYDYSAIYLRTDTAGPDRGYTIAHTVDNQLYFGYNDENNIFPRMRISQGGQVSLNSWEDGTEVLDVNGNARFRQVGNAGSANDLRITADGTLTTSTSDARLKENVKPIDNSLEKILQMEGVTFNWIGDSSHARDAGLVAQDVEDVFPEAVFMNNNDGYFGINYSRFPALFVEAFKEQQQIIASQQEEINQLKSRMERIEKLLRTE